MLTCQCTGGMQKLISVCLLVSSNMVCNDILMVFTLLILFIWVAVYIVFVYGETDEHKVDTLPYIVIIYLSVETGINFVVFNWWLFCCKVTRSSTWCARIHVCVFLHVVDLQMEKLYLRSKTTMRKWSKIVMLLAVFNVHHFCHLSSSMAYWLRWWILMNPAVVDGY